MKKTSIFLLAICLFSGACGTQSTKENKEPENKIENVPDGHEVASAGLALNNGAKWKADEATNRNVQLLKDIVTNSKRGTLEDYRLIAGKLQDRLNKMIEECTMSGPNHEALHKWLEPLIEKVTELKKSEETGKAASIFNEVGKHIDLYSQYFE